MKSENNELLYLPLVVRCKERERTLRTEVGIHKHNIENNRWYSEGVSP